MSRKNKHFRKGRFVMSKKTVCMPAHLTQELARHVAEQAFDRGWSNSQYLRFLVMMDKKCCEDDANLMSEVTGIDRERFDLSERNERIKKA